MLSKGGVGVMSITSLRKDLVRYVRRMKVKSAICTVLVTGVCSTVSSFSGVWGRVKRSKAET